MFYERSVRSFGKLVRELARLDFDSGVRVSGSFEGNPCFAFITRSSSAYTVMVFERKGGRTPRVGARILSKEYDSVDALGRLLADITKKKVEAFVY